MSIRTRAAAVLIGAAVTVCLVAPAAEAHHHHGATFAGSCQLTGQVTFTPPLTNTPQPTRDIAVERGTCSGSLTRHGRTRSLSDAPARYFATDFGQAGSCGGSVGATGWGILALHGARIRFTLTENRAAGVAQLSLAGDGGGSAQGVASLSPTVSPVQIAEACVGPGLASAPVEITLQTTPALSG